MSRSMEVKCIRVALKTRRMALCLFIFHFLLTIIRGQRFDTQQYNIFYLLI
jgi:hypothetical protein